jgi:16S rRNA (uracil1498-N3)-methyltransferase
MRAALLQGQNFSLRDTLSVIGETHHHLANVIRLEKSEQVLLLNGSGGKALARVLEITKKEIQFAITEISQVSKRELYDVLILIPKREALESMLKAAVEMGVGCIYLAKGQRSPEKFPEERRVQALMQSALEQSNNPWMPEVIECVKLSDISLVNYGEILMLDVALDSSKAAQKVRIPGQKTLLIVGPEGGYTPEERAMVFAWPQTRVVSLPTPILRAPTALIAGLGWCHARA